MNPKIFVGIACAALVVALGGILLVGPTMVVAPQENNSQPSNVLQVKPLEVKLEKLQLKQFQKEMPQSRLLLKLLIQIHVL